MRHCYVLVFRPFSAVPSSAALLPAQTSGISDLILKAKAFNKRSAPQGSKVRSFILPPLTFIL
jgi:hypothetical protein